MAKKRKKKIQKNNYYDVLKEKTPVTVHELIKMIHRINPTGEDISEKKASERYKIKAQLQSLLIRRFKERLIVEQPEPENRLLVGLRLRHFDEEASRAIINQFTEDACHAIINELDEDARSWTQRQIDEALTDNPFESTKTSEKSIQYKSTVPVDYSPAKGIEEKEKNLTKDELITLGQNALTEYDYDASEKYYHRALKASPDDPAPTLLLLELYVDHLAAYEKALELSNTISIGVKKNDKVKVLLALAAARSDRIDLALEYIKHTSHPKTSEVYLLSVKHFIQKGDINRASHFLNELASFEQAELNLEMEQLAKNIQSLRAKSLEPIEQEMIFAQEQGRTEDSLKLADRILSVSPENKAARRIRHKFEKQQRDEKINRFLGLADKAKKNKDFRREAELLKKATACGAKAENLAKRLEYAQNEAKRKKEEIEIQNILHLMAERNKEKAFLHYINLNERQRSHINNKIHDPHLAWLDQILGDQTTTKAEKMVEAVLALGKSREALQKQKGPESIIAEMEFHGKALQSVPEAHYVLQQAQILLKAVKYKEAKDMLENAARFLEKENSQKARSCMDRIKVSLLKESDKAHFDDINHRLHYLEKFIRLKQKYIDAHDRGDHFAAGKIAGELAKHRKQDRVRGQDQDTAAYWFDRQKEHASLIKKEWALVSVDIDELPMYYASFGLTWITEDMNCCLPADKRALIIATSHERWIFLRIFCLDDQKFKKAIILRTPRQMHFRKINAVGNALWITGEDGAALELCLQPLNILSWHDFSSFAREEEVIEGVWLFPKSKSLWLNKRNKKSDIFEICEIIDIHQQRVCRQVKSSGYPMVINTGGHFRVAIQNMTTKTVQVYSEQGKPVDSFAFEHYQTTYAATVHPNRNDFIFLPFNDSESMNPFREFDEEQQGDLVLNIEVKPDLKEKYQPVIIKNSNGELQHLIFTSLDTGIIFIFFIDNSSEPSEYILAAFKETAQGFAQLYEVSVPRNIAFAYDEFSKHLAAINFQGNKVQAVILNEDPPVFDFKPHKPVKKVFPEFRSDYYFCNNPTGHIKATSLAYMAQIRNETEKELSQAINKMKQSNTPDEMSALIYALHRTFQFDKENDLKLWMRTQYPNHFSVLLDCAEEAAQEKKWSDVVSLLERISRTDLNDGTARHICHLLGIGYFIQGEIEKAEDIWMEGITYENGECDLAPYIEYAKLSLMPAKKRQKQKGNVKEILNIFESIDNHLAHKRWRNAIETMEKTDVLSKNDLQIMSRLTWAYLNQNVMPSEMQWLFKVIVLASYCQIYNNDFMQDNKVLPPYLETWTESRLRDIAKQAKQWLDNL